MSIQTTLDSLDDAVLKRRLGELQALQTIAHAVASQVELSAVLQAIVTAICQNSSWDLCDIVAVNERAQRSELMACYPLTPDHHVGRSWPLSTSVTTRVLERGEPLAIRDVLEEIESPTWRAGALARGYRGALIVPLPLKDPPSAIWLFSRRPYQATEEEIIHVMTIADHVAVAIRNAQLYERQREATARFERLLDTQTRLIHQVLAGATLETLAQVASRMLGNPVVILNQLLHVIAQGPSETAGQPASEKWRYFEELRETRRTPPRLTRLLHESRLAPLRTTIVEADAASSAMPWRMLAAPLTAGDQALGYLLVVEADRPFEPLDEVVSQQVGLAAAIELMRQNAAFEAENRVRSDVFHRLFKGSWSDKREMIRLASHLSLDLEATNGLLLVRPSIGPDLAPDPLARERILASLIPLLTRQGAGIVAVRQGEVIVVIVRLSDPSPAALRVEAGRFARALEPVLGQTPVIVVGPVVSSVEQYPSAKRECDRALRICELMGRSGVVTLADLGSYRLLGTLENADGMRTFVDDMLGPLLAYEQRRQIDLIGTLKAYFANNGALHQTAEQLFIHISTLRYRLERVKTLTQLDLNDPETRFSLQLALRCRDFLTLDTAASARPGGRRA